MKKYLYLMSFIGILFISSCTCNSKSECNKQDTCQQHTTVVNDSAKSDTIK